MSGDYSPLIDNFSRNQGVDLNTTIIRPSKFAAKVVDKVSLRDINLTNKM